MELGVLAAEITLETGRPETWPGSSGPAATLALFDATTVLLAYSINSLMLGPLAAAVFGAAMNRLLTRPELRDIPLLRHTLPRSDPDRVVVTSATLGVVFYMLVVAVATGKLIASRERSIDEADLPDVAIQRLLRLERFPAGLTDVLLAVGIVIIVHIFAKAPSGFNPRCLRIMVNTSIRHLRRRLTEETV